MLVDWLIVGVIALAAYLLVAKLTGEHLKRSADRALGVLIAERMCGCRLYLRDGVDVIDPCPKHRGAPK